MITEIKLENYRGFAEHTIPLRPTSIIVGRNNAGKSTITEALTLISIVVARAQRGTFLPPPDWLSVPTAVSGISPSLKGIEFEYRNLCYQYREGAASISAKLMGNKAVSIFINPTRQEIFATLRSASRPITSSAAARTFADHEVNVLPPIGRLTVRERVLQDKHVRANLNTNLAPSHFRNQIYYLGNTADEMIGLSDEVKDDVVTPTYYDKFVSLAQSSWPNLKIERLEISNPIDRELNLFVRDGRFVAEVGWVGHGLQAWLQTCWFLARCRKLSTVVLDEPDIYLHPDLQRRLFKLVSGHFEQVVIATHSTEVLAEVNPENVLIVEKDSKQSKFAETIPAVQSIVNHIGGAHNLQLTRLWSARKCIFIEGDDLEFLSVFHLARFPDSAVPLTAIPSLPFGGFGNWKLAAGAAMGLRNAGDEAIKAYCILDSDYHTQSEHAKIQKEAQSRGLNLHIWSRKEIENFVVVPSAISRYIGAHSGLQSLDPAIVRNQIEQICDEMQSDVFDQIAGEIAQQDRKGTLSALKEARKLFEPVWSSFEGKLSLCPGKQIISSLSAWSKEKFGVSFGALSIARELMLYELSPEVVEVVSTIESGGDFDVKGSKAADGG